MNELDKHINKFRVIIHDLIDLSPTLETNVRLGGSMILKTHGLNFSRPTGDLDVIVTNPSQKQKDYLRALRFFNIEDDYFNNDTNYKFKKDNYILNILVVENYNEKITPTYYMFEGRHYGIVSIDEIIAAKKRYGRSKDVHDFLMLKNENFNM